MSDNVRLRSLPAYRGTLNPEGFKTRVGVSVSEEYGDGESGHRLLVVSPVRMYFYESNPAERDLRANTGQLSGFRPYAGYHTRRNFDL